MPLSLEESALVPKERIVPSRTVLVEKCDDDGNRFVTARLTARGDQDPELLSLVKNQLTSAPSVSTNDKVVTVQVTASLGADVELGDVTGAFLESAELRRQGGKLFLRQPSSGLPGQHPQQLLYIRLPLYWLNDSPKMWFLEVSTFLRNIGWKPSALDGCVFMFYDPDSKALAGILCLHVYDLLLGAVAWPSVKQSMRSVHVSHSANGKEIKESSVVASFLRTSSPKRSLCFRVPAR